MPREVNNTTNILNENDKAQTLAEISQRVRQHGERVARPDIHRARQFMPFASLKGFTQMAKEYEQHGQQRQKLNDEQIVRLNNTITHLQKGDLVTVVFYTDTTKETLTDTVVEIIYAARLLKLQSKQIVFDNIQDLQFVPG